MLSLRPSVQLPNSFSHFQKSQALPSRTENGASFTAKLQDFGLTLWISKNA
jgi:hypothetical protein